MENKNGHESEREMWYLCSFCYRGFLSLKKLTLHKIQVHEVSYDEPRKHKEKASSVKRTSPPNERKKKPRKSHISKESPTTAEGTNVSVKSTKEDKLQMRYQAPRKASRKTRLSIHKQTNEKSLLKKVLLRNWLTAVTPELMQKTSFLFAPEIDPLWQNASDKIEGSIIQVGRSLPSHTVDEQEYTKLEQLGSQLNSWIQVCYNKFQFLEQKATKGDGKSAEHTHLETVCKNGISSTTLQEPALAPLEIETANEKPYGLKHPLVRGEVNSTKSTNRKRLLESNLRRGSQSLLIKCPICSCVSFDQYRYRQHYDRHRKGRVVKTKQLKIIYY